MILRHLLSRAVNRWYIRQKLSKEIKSTNWIPKKALPFVKGEAERDNDRWQSDLLIKAQEEWKTREVALEADVEKIRRDAVMSCEETEAMAEALVFESEAKIGQLQGLLEDSRSETMRLVEETSGDMR